MTFAASTADSFATDLLTRLSPDGALAEVAIQHAADEFDTATARFNVDATALAKLREPSLVSRFEDGFAAFVPVLALGELPLENWAIPLLAGLLGGPFAGLLSFGLLMACKVAFYALKAWADKRAAKAQLGDTT